MHRALAAIALVSGLLAFGPAMAKAPKTVEAAFPDAKQVGEATFLSLIHI